jgi:DNA-binding NarL/FixJ family response regulator
MLLALMMEVVGEAADWDTTLANAPTTRLDMLLIDWNLLPSNLGVQALPALRVVCSRPIVIVMISNLEAFKQAAFSAGADAFISKGDTAERVALHLRHAAAMVRMM